MAERIEMVLLFESLKDKRSCANKIVLHWKNNFLFKRERNTKKKKPRKIIKQSLTILPYFRGYFRIMTDLF